jgi:hypothetical protein
MWSDVVLQSLQGAAPRQTGKRRNQSTHDADLHNCGAGIDESGEQRRDRPPPCAGLRTKMSSAAAASTAQKAVSMMRATGTMAQIGIHRVEVLIARAAMEERFI